jgi:hypothetical protein
MAKKKLPPGPDDERNIPDGDEKVPAPLEAEGTERVWRRPDVQQALERILRGLPHPRGEEGKK